MLIAPDVPAGRISNQREAPAKKGGDGCRVTGRVVSQEWQDLGGGIERAIVTAKTLPDLVQVAEVYGDDGKFEMNLPPGRYRLDYSANGTRGATFQFENREIVIAKDQEVMDVGQIDLPISKTTALYGQQAPDLTGIIGWQNTPPLTVKGLRGKVIVLDFFADYCSLCHAHKPDLEKLRQRYEREGLVVLAIHESTVKDIDEMNAKMGPILRQVFQGDPPKLPMALDGAGDRSVFEAYGIHAVPAVILIDPRGRVVRRYHHAGKPELEADVQSLLKASFQGYQ